MRAASSSGRSPRSSKVVPSLLVSRSPSIGSIVPLGPVPPAPGAWQAPLVTDDLCFRPATELAAMVRGREISARELLEAHLDRIDRLNPAINAVVTLDAEGARTAADAAEDELVVARRAAAGTVRVGKTNVPEFETGSHTFNPVFGVTHNPYRHGLSAGGSSGGAAAALAAGLVPVAEGSDMGGSLRNPAAFCNVVGLRPTPGRVPTWPAAMGWSQLSVQGPMGRTVADVALQLSVLAGPDPRVPISLGDDGSPFAAPLLDRLDGLRVAWAPDLGGRIAVDPAVIDVLESSVGVFESLGGDIDEACPKLDGADEVFGTLRAWLFDTAYSDLTRRHPDKVKDSIRWNA